ncbi:TIGR01777 family protein [Vespertiliibacter pulmonis]|uniref:TIGR01777 family protein n=1 Tax=Vespertiliibacter pulmonis TaxID=1443036 RepID=A0A3N4VKR2_9PAST|nr:TIGR01777 family oxidoreductase [Vespertiliibacter pulmonis]QLB21185.1 TIGR01777 family protein [Vespertiliibacter pulmonis]RPE83706.1 hypothetical protein EDC46_0907 [Vespertiliibacter pulmonis]
MHIFITGGTGFIGQALCQTLISKGHTLTVLTRQTKTSTQAVNFVSNFTHLDNFDAVINLAGEPIFAHRWTTKQKQKLVDSRLNLTKKIVNIIQQSNNPPAVFLSASATGIYGNLSKFAEICEALTACDPSFPAQLCQKWEKEALKAQNKHTRVCLLRTGIVLDKSGSALKQMLPLYRLGLGGKLGSGKQHWAWIALEDEIRAICFLLENSNSKGAYNLVAPHSVSNAEFNHRLAKQLHRPAFFAVPQWLLKLVLGERSQLLLDNQPLVPQKLLNEGFTFNYPNLSDLL